MLPCNKTFFILLSFSFFFSFFFFLASFLPSQERKKERKKKKNKFGSTILLSRLLIASAIPPASSLLLSPPSSSSSSSSSSLPSSSSIPSSLPSSLPSSSSSSPSSLPSSVPLEDESAGLLKAFLGSVPKKDRKRSRIKSACVRCKVAKTGCEDQRPCHRCKRLGYEDSCVDEVPLRHEDPQQTLHPPLPAELSREQPPQKKQKKKQATEYPLDHHHPHHHQLYDHNHHPCDHLHPHNHQDAASFPSTSFSSSSSPSSAAPMFPPPSLSAPLPSSSNPPFGHNILTPGDSPSSPAWTDSSSSDRKDFVGEAANTLIENFLEGLIGNTSLFIEHKSSFADSGNLRMAYFQTTYQELTRWHARILSGEVPATAPMYILYCRHYLDMVTTFKGLSPDAIEQRKEELFANLPQSEQLAEFMDEKVAYISQAEEIGDKVTNLVYDKLPIAVMKFTHQNFVITPIFINDYAKELFGVIDDDIVTESAGLMITRLFHPDHWFSLALAICSGIVNHQNAIQYKGVLLDKNGKTFEGILTIQLEYTRGPIPSLLICYMQRC